MDFAGLIPTFGNLVWTVVAFVVALSIIVAIHEYGHYIVGRWSGIRAEVFSIGFGPKLISRVDRRGTRWQVAAVPLGGYVRFLGDSSAASGRDEAAMAGLDEEELRHTMHGAPLWARAATVLAGPAFNFLLSFVIFAAILMLKGVAVSPLTVQTLRDVPGFSETLKPGDVLVAIDGQTVPPVADFPDFAAALTPAPSLDYTVRRDGREMVVQGPWLYPPLASSVTPGSPADDAGFLTGDVVTGVNGSAVFDFDQLRNAVGDSGGKPMTMTVRRQGQTLEMTVTPRRQDLPLPDGSFETRYLIGMTGGLAFVPKTGFPGVGEALNYGANQVVYIVTSSVSGLYHMVAGKISTCNLSGPIGIAQSSGEAASLGLETFLWFIAVLSTAVGFLNLLPIPVLDGGHLVFHAWEAATGRPPSDRALRYLMAGGLTIMLALMLFAVGNDLFCN